MNSVYCKFFPKGMCRNGDKCNFPHIFSKSELIENYLIDYGDSKMIKSSFNYIVLIFENAGIVTVLSLLEAYRFEYFKSILDSPMRTELKRLDAEHQQFYYIVPSDFYRTLHKLSLKIFSEMHEIESNSCRIDTCQTYFKIAADKSMKDKSIDGYKHLCDVFSLAS
jgi:hypothetical protein